MISVAAWASRRVPARGARVPSGLEPARDSSGVRAGLRRRTPEAAETARALRSKIEHELRAAGAQLDQISRMDRDRTGNTAAIDERAVARIQIDDRELSAVRIAHNQLHVPAADKLVPVLVEADLAGNVASESQFLLAVNRETLRRCTPCCRSNAGLGRAGSLADRDGSSPGRSRWVRLFAQQNARDVVGRAAGASGFFQIVDFVRQGVGDRRIDTIPSFGTTP